MHFMHKKLHKWRRASKKTFTNNGTNFKATAKMFKEEDRTIDVNRLAQQQNTIKWAFNPLAATGQSIGKDDKVD